MTFKPTANRLLIKRADAETKTSSGFIIPDASVEKANQGTVISMGPGRITDKNVSIPIDGIAVGDTVMFEPGAAIPIRVENEDLLILKEENIIAVVS